MKIKLNDRYLVEIQEEKGLSKSEMISRAKEATKALNDAMPVEKGINQFKENVYVAKEDIEDPYDADKNLTLGKKTKTPVVEKGQSFTYHEDKKGNPWLYMGYAPKGKHSNGNEEAVYKNANTEEEIVVKSTDDYALFAGETTIDDILKGKKYWTMEEWIEKITNSKKLKDSKKSKIKEAKIIVDLEDYTPWSGAVETFERIKEEDKLEEFDRLLEEIYPDGLTITELNDLLWFDDEYVLEQLGIYEEEDIEVDEDDEEIEDIEEILPKEDVEDSCTKDNVGEDISQYQKWVDYDMKKYGRISELTMSKIKKAGLSVVKDQYGDYEVIAYRPLKDRCSKKVKDAKEIDSDFASAKMENGKVLMGVARMTTTPTRTTETVELRVGYNVKSGVGKDYWYNRPWYKYTYANALYSAIIAIGESSDFAKQVIENTSGFREAIEYIAKNSIVLNLKKKANDTLTKDVPEAAPVWETSIVFGNKVKGGATPTTLSMLREAAKKDKSKFTVLFEDVMNSIKSDISNAKALKSAWQQSELDELVRQYTEAADLAESIGLVKQSTKLNDKITVLEDALKSFTWEEPKFTEENKIRTSEKYRALKRGLKENVEDADILSKWKVILKVTPTALKQSYIDAKNKVREKIFKFNLDKVIDDAFADYSRILNGNDYYSTRYPKSVLEEIVDHYENASKYAKELGYDGEAIELDKYIETIKENWYL